MQRLKLPEPADLTPGQAEAIREVVSGPRGTIPAPMVAWLRNPELARRGQLLGELLRFDTSLPPRRSELAILACARHWTSHHEWTAHKRIALAAGLESEAIAAIAAGRDPGFADPSDRCVLEATQAMLRTGRLDERCYDSALAVLGEVALVELTALVGYYTMVALTLNVFRLGLPGNAAPELEDASLAAGA